MHLLKVEPEMAKGVRETSRFLGGAIASASYPAKEVPLRFRDTMFERWKEATGV